MNKEVSIFGSARTQENSDTYNITKELSRDLADNGYQVITEGGPGIMKAAIEGSYLSGNKSIALNLKLPFEGSSQGHPGPTKSKTIKYQYL